MRWLRTGSLLAAVLCLPAMEGCRHKVTAPPPQVSTAPPLPPTSMTQVPAVPPLPAPAQPQVGPPGSDQKAQETKPEPPRHPRRSKKHPAPPDATTSAAVTPAVPAASSGTPAPAVTQPAAPSLGQLSAGTGADSHERAAMSEQIHAQEVRLSKIKQPLSEDDKAITEQIQAFLAKARQAVSENDLDGAQTLTTKAKVLLDELTRS